MPDNTSVEVRGAGLARWLSVLVLGFVAGAATVMLADPSTSETRVLASSDTPAAPGPTDASAAGEHHDESAMTYEKLPKKTKAEVDQVRALWATRYPTAADAAKDGWFRGTRSLYGIGAHYIQGARGLSVAVPFDLLNPPVLLFDGDGPDAKFAGVSYIVAEKSPEGFTGDFDSWHAHSSVCRRGGSIDSLSDEGSDVWWSESECVAAGGSVFPLVADNMMHLWIGPDYIEGAAIFAHDHPKLFDGFNPKRDG